MVIENRRRLAFQNALRKLKHYAHVCIDENVHNRKGYLVVRGALKFTRKELAYTASLKPKSYGVFNSEPNDGKRLECPISHIGLVRKTKRLCSKYFPHLVASHIVCVTSCAGCKEQQLHCDMNPYSFAIKEQCPMTALISIHDNGKLKVCEGSHLRVRQGVIGPKREIVLKAGDAIFFRTDLVHHGCAYEQDHQRLVALLNMPNMLQQNLEETFKL